MERQQTPIPSPITPLFYYFSYPLPDSFSYPSPRLFLLPGHRLLLVLQTPTVISPPPTRSPTVVMTTPPPPTQTPTVGTMTEEERGINSCNAGFPRNMIFEIRMPW
eukprot:scaffold2249_cov86-Cylindrotheca_fusiformis.AAC.4